MEERIASPSRAHISRDLNNHKALQTCHERDEHIRSARVWPRTSKRDHPAVKIGAGEYLLVVLEIGHLIEPLSYLWTCR